MGTAQTNVITITEVLDKNGGVATSYARPLSTVDNGAGAPTDTRYDHSYGFRYKGGKSTLAFYGDFGDDTTIKIQAAFDGGVVTTDTDDTLAVPAPQAGNFIDLTDSQGEVVTVSGNDIVTLDIGKCVLRFHITVNGTDTGTINVAIS